MIQNVITIFLIGLLAIVSPGPDFFVILRNSLRGAWAAARTVNGILVGSFLQISACVLGISVVLEQNHRLFQIVKFAGAAYLIYLGVKGLITAFWLKSAPIVANHDAALPSSQLSNFRQGLWCNLLNPKFTVFLISVFAQFTGPETSLAERLLYGAVLWLQAAVYWYLLAFLLKGSRAQALVAKSARYADPVLATVLAALGLRLMLAS